MNIPIILKSTHPQETFDRLARRALFGFIMTFIVSRICVFLIMSGRMPNFYFFLQGTHVHHLNYGIFLLSAVCGYSIFARPDGREAEIAALVYGLAMGLTFDEFGMWLHLGGSYWQRASFDAVVVILSALGLLAFAPRWRRLRAHHFAVGAAMLLIVASFCLLLIKSLSHANDKITPRLIEMEKSGPE